MPARSIKVWNSTTSEWEDVAVASPDTSSFVQNSLVNAKGDLISATADNTPAVLTAGSNGQMLMADSSATAGLRYVDPPANRNLLVNGSHQVAQRGTSTTGITTSGYYTADRWQVSPGSFGTWTNTVENDAPAGSGLTKSIKVLCTTAQTSPAANASFQVRQFLEGQDLQRIKKGTASAEQLSLSFWVKSNVTGTYFAEIRDHDNNRFASVAYTVSASATWERKTVTFPADTTGALDNDNARSLDVNFWLGAGTDWSSGSVSATWHTTNANRVPGQTNLAAATNNYWQVTGVQLETGIATPFEFEPFEATLRKCQRYFQNISTDFYTSGFGYAVDTTNIYLTVPTAVPMRANPTLTSSANMRVRGNAQNITPSAFAVAGRNDNLIYLTATVTGATANQAYVLAASSTATLSAEL